MPKPKKMKKKKREEEDLDLDERDERDDEDQEDDDRKDRRLKAKSRKSRHTDDEDLDDELDDSGDEDDSDDEEEDESSKKKRKFAGRFSSVEELEEAYAALVDKGLKSGNEDEDEEEEDEEQSDKITMKDLAKAFKEDPIKTMLYITKTYGASAAKEVVDQSLSDREKKALKAKFMVLAKEEFPELFKEGSKLRKKASEVYASKPWLKEQPDGILQAAMEAERSLKKSKKKEEEVEDSDIDDEDEEIDDQHLDSRPLKKKHGKEVVLNEKEKKVAIRLRPDLPAKEAIKRYQQNKMTIQKERELV